MRRFLAYFEKMPATGRAAPHRGTRARRAFDDQVKRPLPSLAFAKVSLAF